MNKSVKTYVRLFFSGWMIVSIIGLPARFLLMLVFYMLSQPYFLIMLRSREEMYRFRHEIREEINDTKKLRDWLLSGNYDKLPVLKDEDYYDGK